MQPWNLWYHCMGNTYGTWLPGDERGFRSENGKLAVPHDYRNPPPKGKYDGLRRYSRSLLKREPVFLETMPQRQRVLDEFIASLHRRQIPIAIGAVGRVHFHHLIQVFDLEPRKWIGLAKKESSHYCKQTGDAPVGGLWGDYCECKPITDDAHWDNAFDYIAKHAKRGSALYVPVAEPRVVKPLADFDPHDLLID